MNTVIRNGLLIPMDESCEHRSLRADIAIEGDQIRYIGNIPAAFRADRTIDAEGKIVLPGLVNAHTHLSMGLLRNYADDMELFDWLNNRIWPVEGKLTPEDVYIGSRLGILEMILSGTTAFADMYFFQEATCEAVRESGIRASIGLTFFGDQDATEQRLEIYQDLHHRWNGKADGRIRLDTAPHAIYTCSEATLRAAVKFSAANDTRIHTHLSETLRENADAKRQHRMSPTQYLETMGIFDRPGHAAHCVHMSADDRSILKQHGIYPVHNPSSNMKLGSGFSPLPEFISEGLHVAMGTDGASSNNNLNMVEEMHIASLIHKGHTGDPTVVTAYDTLKMATLHGAQALGIDEICGSITVGKNADLIIIDTSAPHLTPLNNPVSAIVYSAQAADIETLICAGRIVMDERKITTMPVETVIREAAACARKLLLRS